MNKMKLIYAVILGMLFAACSEEDNLSQAGKTGFRVSLAESVEVDSRSTPENLDKPTASQFALKITNQTTGSELYNGSYTDQLIPAVAGMYDIEATYGDNPVLALDEPYYKGSAEDVEVTSGEKSVPISCEVANALASVAFGEGFDEQFSSYGVKVEVDDRSVTLTSKGESAYYRAGSKPKFTFVGTLKEGGKEISKPLAHEKFSEEATFAAKAHCQITLKQVAAAPGAQIEIDKVTVENVTINETIPMKWLPKPKVTAEGFDGNNTLTFVETETKEAKLNLELSSALQDVKFKFDFEDKQFSLDKEKVYQWSNAEDKQVITETLGISVSDENINLNGLLAKLKTNAGTPTTNAVEIDVQANGRWSSEDESVNQTYKMVCNKPEFSIAVQEGNVWSKTFTIDEPTITTGNVDVLKKNLQYQYKAKGDETWQTCSNGLMQAFAEHPENKEYQVRAFYREGITSNVVDVTLETPTQLPNSGMEEWYWLQVHEDQGGLNFIDSNTYTVYPWSENGTSFWNTNNDFSTRNRGTFSNIYNCFPTTSFVKDAHSGTWAVELRNTGNGRGNTIPENVLDMNKVAGELFTGDIQVSTGGTDATPSGDNYTITKGRSFSVRPTALKFWYKYSPLNSDTWRVHLELIDAEDNVIIEKTVESSEVQSSWKEFTVPS